TVASALATVGLDMDGHTWTRRHVARARAVLLIAGLPLVATLARHLGDDGAGWAVVSLPAVLHDEDLQRVAAGILAGLGTPFYSINGGDGLWLRGLSAPDRDPGSFGGYGRNDLHIDAPNVTCPPDYTSLLILRPDLAGGGASVIGDLRAAMAALPEQDQDVLRQPVFFEGRADRLHGVGESYLPFPILDDGPRYGWVRWAGKLLSDDRNRGHLPVLERFAQHLDQHVHQMMLGRGDLLIADQRRVAHGREPLGAQDGIPDARRRLLCQAKVRFEAAAPVQHLIIYSRGDHDGH
ncbi:MAG: TauD/TfdA family dioxygenase, partial [Sciscionella sp.]